MPMHFKPFLGAKVTNMLHNENIKRKEYSVCFLCHLHVHICKLEQDDKLPIQGRTPIARKKAKIVTLTITRSKSPQTWPTASSTGLEWPRRTQHKRFWLEQCFGYRKKRCSQIRVCNVLAFCGPGSLLTANTRHCTTYTHLLLQVKTCCFLRKANVLTGWLCGTWSTHLSNMR